MQGERDGLETMAPETVDEQEGGKEPGLRESEQGLRREVELLRAQVVNLREGKKWSRDRPRKGREAGISTSMWMMWMQATRASDSGPWPLPTAISPS